MVSIWRWVKEQTADPMKSRNEVWFHFSHHKKQLLLSLVQWLWGEFAKPLFMLTFVASAIVLVDTDAQWWGSESTEDVFEPRPNQTIVQILWRKRADSQLKLIWWVRRIRDPKCWINSWDEQFGALWATLTYTSLEFTRTRGFSSCPVRLWERLTKSMFHPEV